MKHFGVEVKEGKHGLELKREKYAAINTKSSLPKFNSLQKRHAYIDEEGKYYTEEWCNSYRELCLQNFDLNMKFFSSLDHDEFNDEVNKFKKIQKF